jgi:hypothetical protein
MSETKSATETLLKKSVVVELLNEEGEPYEVAIHTFSFAKTLRTFALLSELAASAGVGKTVKAATEDTVAAEAEGSTTPPVATNFIQAVLELLPAALKNGVPAVYKLIGLIVTGNKALKEMEKSDTVNVDEVLLERGRDLTYDNGVDEVVTLISGSIQVMGVETIVRNVVPLVRALRVGA